MLYRRVRILESSDFPRSLCFKWSWFGLEILRLVYKKVFLNTEWFGFYFIWPFILIFIVYESTLNEEEVNVCIFCGFFSNRVLQICGKIRLPGFKSSQVRGKDLAKFLDEWIEHRLPMQTMQQFRFNPGILPHNVEYKGNWTDESKQC